MNYRMIIRPEAERDIEESYNWYEDQSVGLGKEFLRALDAALTSILRNPLAYPVIHRNIRRSLIRRFPHSLFYLINENNIVVTACVHHRRNPRVWQRR